MTRTTQRFLASTLVLVTCTAGSTLILQRAFAQSGTWTHQLKVPYMLYSVKAVDQNIGWVAGENGVVLRTVDGGSNWKSVGDLGMGIGWSIEALDSNTAWLATTTTEEGGETFVFKTTDGGGQWQKVYSLVASGAYIDCLKMFDANTGFAVGDPVGGKWLVLKTTDSGSSWAHTPTEPNTIGDQIGFLNILSVVSATDIRFGAGGDTARMYQSTDAGVTWKWYRIPLPANTYTQALKFNTPQIGVVGSSSKTLARTTDGGVTWASFTLPGPGTWGLSGYETTFFAANWYAVQVSTNNGETWTPSYQNNIGQLVGTDFVKRSGTVRGWVIGATAEGTNIVSYFEATTSVPGSEAGQQPSAASLYQNYPNPFNPSTTIHYGLPQRAHVILAVLNALGQQVAVLQNGEQEAGYHDVQFDGSGLSSGVYFYRIRAGNFVQTRRLLLLK